MSQMSITLMGEGEVFYEGKRMPAKVGLDAATIPTIIFRERDGLASINGSDLITETGCIQLYDAERLLRTQEITLAMTLEALNANMTAFDARLTWCVATLAHSNVQRTCAG